MVLPSNAVRLDQVVLSAPTTHAVSLPVVGALLEPGIGVQPKMDRNGISRQVMRDSPSLGIHPGETYTLEDLLYGLMLPSGNDAALAIANAIGGSVEHFVAMMNDEVTDLGLHDSHFVNPHGLDAPDHYASAYDLTMAARYGMQHYPEFRKVVGTETWVVHGTRSFTIENLNRFLGNYPGADGVKIGFTDDAGRTIVASATRNGHQVFVAVMKVGDWVSNTAPLFNWAYQNFTW